MLKRPLPMSPYAPGEALGFFPATPPTLARVRARVAPPASWEEYGGTVDPATGAEAVTAAPIVSPGAPAMRANNREQARFDLAGTEPKDRGFWGTFGQGVLGFALGGVGGAYNRASGRYDRETYKQRLAERIEEIRQEKADAHAERQMQEAIRLNALRAQGLELDIGEKKYEAGRRPIVEARDAQKFGDERALAELNREQTRLENENLRNPQAKPSLTVTWREDPTDPSREIGTRFDPETKTQVAVMGDDGKPLTRVSSAWMRGQPVVTDTETYRDDTEYRKVYTRGFSQKDADALTAAEADAARYAGLAKDIVEYRAEQEPSLHLYRETDPQKYAATKARIEQGIRDLPGIQKQAAQAQRALDTLRKREETARTAAEKASTRNRSTRRTVGGSGGGKGDAVQIAPRGDVQSATLTREAANAIAAGKDPAKVIERYLANGGDVEALRRNLRPEERKAAGL